MAEFDAVETTPTEACDADGEGGAFVFAECFQEGCYSWLGHAVSVPVQEGDELEHRGEGVVA